MKQASGIPFSTIVFDDTADTPRYRQLYSHIRDLIVAGAMPTGLHLPSSRDLATELGVARNTVIAAYGLLVDEQFIESVPGRGTVVRAIPFLHDDVRTGTAASDVLPRPAPRRMVFAMPDSARFPTDVWKRILRNAAKHACLSATRPPIAGDARLRRLVCAYLGAYRGVRCREEQVLITTGGQQALYLAGQVLRDFTDAMFIEDPGYFGAHRAYDACGFHLYPVPVDEHGARFDMASVSTRPEARAVYLTPSHQFPLGPTLSLDRRMNILNWTRECDGWVIEDDYDTEFRYDGKPLTALAGLDVVQRVIYVGTFSKVLSPELRVGYVVAPEPLAKRFHACKEFCDGAGAMLVQAAIADFIQDGHFQAHLRRMRAVYRNKRDRVLQLLREHDVPVGVQARPAGMHVTLLLEQGCSDIEITQRMAEHGFETLPLSKLYLEESNARHGLLAGFTGASDADIEGFVATLGAVLAS